MSKHDLVLNYLTPSFAVHKQTFSEAFYLRCVDHPISLKKKNCRRKSVGTIIDTCKLHSGGFHVFIQLGMTLKLI